MVIFAWCMTSLTFPSGLLVSAAVVAIATATEGTGLLPTGLPANQVGIVAAWLAFSSIGYFQWFMVVPWVWRKVSKQPEPAQNDA
jgi:hypothetical protein